jgi:hypothetical protein
LTAIQDLTIQATFVVGCQTDFVILKAFYKLYMELGSEPSTILPSTSTSAAGFFRKQRCQSGIYQTNLCELFEHNISNIAGAVSNTPRITDQFENLSFFEVKHSLLTFFGVSLTPMSGKTVFPPAMVSDI